MPVTLSCASCAFCLAPSIFSLAALAFSLATFIVSSTFLVAPSVMELTLESIFEVKFGSAVFHDFITSL
jgi:hypothetical protein